MGLSWRGQLKVSEEERRTETLGVPVCCWMFLWKRDALCTEADFTCGLPIIGQEAHVLFQWDLIKAHMIYIKKINSEFTKINQRATCILLFIIVFFHGHILIGLFSV